MKRIKQIFTNWGASRYLRLALGIIFGLAYAFDGQGVYLLFAVFFLVQAAMNIGCGCMSNSCATNTKENKESNYDFEPLNTDRKDV
ncbi:MAG: hypothetical protein ACK5KP_03545 [Paludibacteraceae bacterium]